MNWLTILVLVIFAYNIYSSHKRGFIKTVFDTATIVVAVLLTTVCAPLIAHQISNNEDIYNAISKQVKVMIKEADTIETNEAQVEFIENMTILIIINTAI